MPDVSFPENRPQLAEAIHLLEIRVISTLAYNAVGTRSLAISLVNKTVSLVIFNSRGPLKHGGELWQLRGYRHAC